MKWILVIIIYNKLRCKDKKHSLYKFECVILKPAFCTSLSTLLRRSLPWLYAGDFQVHPSVTVGSLIYIKYTSINHISNETSSTGSNWNVDLGELVKYRVVPS